MKREEVATHSRMIAIEGEGELVFSEKSVEKTASP